MVAFCFGHWLIVNMFQGDRAVYLSEKSARLSGMCATFNRINAAFRTSYRRIAICVMTYSNPEKRLSLYTLVKLVIVTL
jgi:hypothetical protein